MTPSPDSLSTLAAKESLRAALQTIQHNLDENPLLLQRDHFHRMWDDVMQEVLKNLQQIRDDNTALRRSLNESCDQGEDNITKGFAEIKAAIETSTKKIIAAIDGKKKKGWW